MADEIRELTEQERKEQIEYHLAELKKLALYHAVTGMPGLKLYFGLRRTNMLTVYISTQRRKSGKFRQGRTL